MTNFIAIVRADNGEGWHYFANPETVLVTNEPGDVLATLEQVEQYSARGFTAVGYVSYEAASAFDSSLETKTGNQPLLKFAIFREHREWSPPADPPPLNLTLAPEVGKPEYRDAIAQIKSSLEDGASYQVNYTQRLRGHSEAEPIDLFAALVKAQPSRHAFFMQDSQEAICSASPELFFRLEGQEIYMEPMKGTRPRGDNTAEDEALKAELLNSEKERAENLMIVDMVRNDLARIAEPGTVKVPELFKILELPTVWQQVSEVKARTDAGLVALLKALFPCASITGAPKAQTMSIIRDLEVSPRGIYTGALGVVRPGRMMHFNVGIRSVHVDLSSHNASYGTGGGIVWDSQADEEWQETRVKAQLLENTDSFWQLLETLAYHPGEGIRYLEEHLARLDKSARYFDIHYDPQALRKLLSEYESPSAQRLRVLLNHRGKISMESSALQPTGEPVKLTLAKQNVHSSNVFLQHKTTHRKIYDLVCRDQSSADDVILWNERGELTETSICNLFLEFAGKLLTPCSSSGLLPGTLRAHLLAKGECTEAVLTKADLARADKIFVGNSVRGLLAAELVRPN